MFANIDIPDFADPQYNIRDRIDGIVGVDFLCSQIMHGLRRNPLELMAQNTMFGWIIFGGRAAEEKTDTLATVNLVTVAVVHSRRTVAKLIAPHLCILFPCFVKSTLKYLVTVYSVRIKIKLCCVNATRHVCQQHWQTPGQC